MTDPPGATGETRRSPQATFGPLGPGTHHSALMCSHLLPFDRGGVCGPSTSAGCSNRRVQGVTHDRVSRDTPTRRRPVARASRRAPGRTLRSIGDRLGRLSQLADELVELMSAATWLWTDAKAADGEIFP